MRYHIVIYKVPDTRTTRQIPFIDEEWDSVQDMTGVQEAADRLIEETGK